MEAGTVIRLAPTPSSQVSSFWVDGHAVTKASFGADRKRIDPAILEFCFE